MPRLQVADPLQGFRFHVSAVEGGFDPIGYEDGDSGQAGFQSVTTPEMTLEAVEYPAYCLSGFNTQSFGKVGVGIGINRQNGFQVVFE